MHLSTARRSRNNLGASHKFATRLSPEPPVAFYAEVKWTGSWVELKEGKRRKGGLKSFSWRGLTSENGTLKWFVLREAHFPSLSPFFSDFESLTLWLSESLTFWLSDSLDFLGLWISDSVSFWISSVFESLTSWFSESLNFWLFDSVTLWIPGSLTLWLSNSLNPWLFDFLPLWISDSNFLTIWFFDSLTPGLWLWHWLTSVPVSLVTATLLYDTQSKNA